MKSITSTSKTKERLVFLDIAKGIAILFVVAGHLIKTNPTIINHGKALTYLIYSFHMPVFFMLSGMGLYLSFSNNPISFKDFKDKCKKYVKKLLLCYFLWSIISYLLTSIKHMPNTEEWFWCIVTFRGRAPIWFLGSLFWGEIALLLFRMIVKNKIICYLVLMILSAVATVMCTRVMQDISALESLPLRYLGVALARFFPVICFLCIGFLVMHMIQSYKLSWVLYLVFGLLFGIITIFVQLKTNNEVNMHLFVLGNPYIFFLTATFGSFSIVFICKAISNLLPFKLLSTLGKNSLGIMLIHYDPFPTMKHAWLICSYLPALSGVWIYLIAIALTTAISWAFTLLIDKKLLIK